MNWRDMPMWVVIERGNGEIHVLPEGENHRCDECCHCGPWLEDGIWVHNSSEELKTAVKH